GIRFIAGANGSVEYGHQAAISGYVRLPIRWTPACEIRSTVQAVDSLSMLLKIQSSSPPGPETKPSSEIDILRMSFLIALSAPHSDWALAWNPNPAQTAYAVGDKIT